MTVLHALLLWTVVALVAALLWSAALHHLGGPQ